MACLGWGGRGRLALLTRAGTTLAVLVLAAPLAAALPYAALSGVLAGAVLRLSAWRPLRAEASDAAWHRMAAVARQLTGHAVAAKATIDRPEG
jgi:MFS superfamily sulfate permease-like transporter